MAGGILSKGSPAGPYITDDITQNALVRAYFVNAGLPIDQIRDVGATYHSAGGGPIGEPSSSQSSQVVSLNSVVHRAINGILVVESYAAARMTTSGDVDWETVFWPAIDASIVQGAVTFAALVSEPSAHAAFLAKLPGAAGHDSGVVIHHSASLVHGAPVAYVSYDVTLSGASWATDRHFDQNGVEFRLPQELAGPGTPRSP